MQLQDGTQLDPSILKVMKAIRKVESGNSYGAVGDGGASQGAFQYNEKTGPGWKNIAREFLGDENAPMDKANQNKATYYRIKKWKDEGKNPEDIAALWNGATYNTSTGKYVYNNPEYGQKFREALLGGATPTQQQPAPVAQAISKPPVEQKGYSVGGFAKNVVKSGADVIQGIGQVVAHPIQTAKGLGRLVVGAGQLLTPGEQENEKVAKSVGKFFADKYGGVENIKKSLYEDPIGVLLDASTILTGGGALAAKVGTIGKVSGLSRAGKVASTIGKAVDPLQAATKGIGGLLKVSGGAATTGAGITTGVGKEALQSIYEAGKKGGDVLEQTTKALRGKIPPEDVLKNVQSAVAKLVETEKGAYKTKLDKIKATNVSIPRGEINTLRKSFNDQLQELDIIRGADGKFDFSGSILDGDASAMRRVNQIEEKINLAASNPSINNIENLKRFSEKAWKPNDPLNVITQPVKQTTRGILENNIKGYQEMTSRYHEYKDFLDEVHAAIGNPNKATQEAALRKVRSIFRDSQKERLSTTSKLEAKTGANIKGQVAGLISNPILPSGLQKYGTEGLAIGALTGILPATVSASGLVAASPRIMAELARRVGITTRQLESTISAIEKITKLSRNEILNFIGQSGRLNQPSSNPLE